MKKPMLFILITIGACFGWEKRQSEYDDFHEAKRNTRLRTILSTLQLISAGEHPIKEHLIPPILETENSKWKIIEEELPVSQEARNLRWLEDAVHFQDFPLGTIREIEKDAPTAVVVPATKDATLQVAKHGPHVFVTDGDDISDSNLKFIPHHHPSLRTVDLSALADEVNLIFTHPRHHEFAEKLQENPIARILSGLDRHYESDEFDDQQARNAKSDPLQDNQSSLNEEIDQNQQKMDKNQGPVGSAQFDPPPGINASINPFQTTVLVLPDDNPVKKYIKDLQNKMQQNQTIQNDQDQPERSATFHGNQGLLIPSHQTFLPQPTTSFVNHQPVFVNPVNPGFAQFPHQHTTFVNRPFFRSSESKQNNSEHITSVKKAEPTHLHKHKLFHHKFGPKVIPQNIIHIHQQQSANVQNYQPPGYQRVAAPFLVDVPAMHQERIKRSPTISRPSSVFFQPQPSSSFLAPQSPQVPTSFAIVPTNSLFAVNSGPFLSNANPANSNQSLQNDNNDKPFTAEEIEKIITTIPEVFPQPGGYFPIIQGTSPNGLPLQKPSDDPGYADFKKIRPALEKNYFNSFKNSEDNQNKTATLLTKAEFNPLNHTFEESSAQQRSAEEDKLNHLHFFGFDESASANARAAQIDLEEIIGPLSIFELSKPDVDDENEGISIVELEPIFPGEIRAADADPIHHHHHHGTHFFLHKHGFIPNQQFQETVVQPTDGHIPFLATEVNLFHHNGHPSQSQTIAVNGNGNGVSQSQAIAGNFAETQKVINSGGQSVHITGEGNSVSQSQGQTAFVDGVSSPNTKRIRRSIVELVKDPNTKLDVPKTISNIGTVTKASFHDQKKPMYHLNNMVGSIKDVIMSTIKIPPQGLIIPSQYRIVNAAELDDNYLEAKHEITRSINQDLLSNDAEVHQVNQEQSTDPLSDTFNKFGSAIRESIKAGQQTLAHVGDIAHSARQVVHTAKSTAPQIFLPRNQKNPDKVMLVAPKLLEIKNAEEGGMHLLQAQNRKDFVKMGDVMDALAVSNPNEDTLGIEKIVIERKDGARKPMVVGRSKEMDESNLKGFVTKMNGELKSLVKDKLKQEREERRLRKTIRKLEKSNEKVRAPLVRLPQQSSKFDSVLGKVQDHVDIMKTKSDQVLDTIQDVNGKFIDTIRTISGAKPTPKDDVVGVTHIIIPKNFLTTPKPIARLKSTNEEPEYWDKQVSSFLAELFEEKKPKKDEEVVGASQFSRNGLNLRPDLMKPFMGRASEASIKEFLRKHGNKIKEEEVVGAVQSINSSESEMEMEKIRQAKKVLGAVNPLMFEKLFNETMSGSDGKSLSPYEVFSAGRDDTEEQICHDPTKVATSMKITRELLKPFMGRLKGSEYMKIIPVENNGDEEEQQAYYMRK